MGQFGRAVDEHGADAAHGSDRTAGAA
ncbi:RNA polymerase sigma factor, partial [Burkholderia pseudomallei]